MDKPLMVNSDIYKNSKHSLQKGISQRLAIRSIAHAQQLAEIKARVHMTLLEIAGEQNTFWEAAHAIINVMDGDKDGVISLEEFKNFITKFL